MCQETSSPTDAAIIAAKAHWERTKTQRKVKVDFDKLLELFTGNQYSHMQIAKQVGVSREGIRQIYSRYFCGLLGNYDKQKSCELAAQRKEIRIQVSFRKDHPAAAILAVLELKGFNVAPILSKNRAVRKCMVTINDQICSFHSSQTIFTVKERKRETKYFRFTVSKSLCAATTFTILHCCPQQQNLVFVVPSESILQEYLPGNCKKNNLNIPTSNSPVYNNCFPRISWYAYLNAWHLLEVKT
ncbi:MAG: hypothetical protein KBB55_01955 [Candidatus Buchananbacteria bacterium]|nr:hypothetical protein [Candidatus Buchananbacteria bacterium]